MNAKSLSLILATSLFLTGCNWFGPKSIDIKTQAVERVKLTIGEIDPVKLKSVHWILITPENADEVFAKMKKDNYDLVLFGLSDVDYENLSMNTANIRAYIVKQNAVIKAYKEYYEESKPKDKK